MDRGWPSDARSSRFSRIIRRRTARWLFRARCGPTWMAGKSSSETRRCHDENAKGVDVFRCIRLQCHPRAASSSFSFFARPTCRPSCTHSPVFHTNSFNTRSLRKRPRRSPTSSSIGTSSTLARTRPSGPVGAVREEDADKFPRAGSRGRYVFHHEATKIHEDPEEYLWFFVYLRAFRV